MIGFFDFNFEFDAFGGAIKVAGSSLRNYTVPGCIVMVVSRAILYLWSFTVDSRDGKYALSSFNLL